MIIRLSPETERQIEEAMKRTGITDPNYLIRFAFEMWDQARGVAITPLDATTRDLVEDGRARQLPEAGEECGSA